MDRLLRYFLTTAIRRGSQHRHRLRQPFSLRGRFGCPAQDPFSHRTRGPRLVLDPELAFGELYMDGELLIEQGSIADLLALLFDQPEPAAPYWVKLPAAVRRLVRRIRQFNLRRRAQRNVAHHYDPRLKCRSAHRA